MSTKHAVRTDGRKSQTSRASKSLRTVVVVPDLQVWCWPDHLGVWHTCHDEAAIDVALSVIRTIDQGETVDQVIQIGDPCEMANFSSFRTAPALTATGTWPRSQRRTHEVLRAITEATPNAFSRVVLDSNHLWPRIPDLLA